MQQVPSSEAKSLFDDREVKDIMKDAIDANDSKWFKKIQEGSEVIFQSLFEKSSDAMLLLDGNVFIDCNQAAIEMMRCSSKEQLLSLHPYDISPKRQLDGQLSIEKEKEKISSALQGKNQRFEWVHCAVDGKEFPVEVLLTQIPLYNRDILHVVWKDISEHKRVGEELQEREAQYRSIFESTSDGFLIYSLDGKIVEANPAACNMYNYPYEELIGLFGKDIIHPDYHQLFDHFMEQVKMGGSFNAQSVDIRKDGSSMNIEVHGTSFRYKGKSHLLAVVRDVTDRVLARQRLENHVKERTHELSTLLKISRDIASTLELKPLLGLVLDQLKDIVDYSGATILKMEGNDLIVLAYRGPIPQEEALKLCFKQEHSQVNHEVIQRREPVIIPDVRDNTPLAQAFQKSAGERPKNTFSYIRTWMGVPLIVKNQVIGMLTLDHREPNYYSPKQAELAFALANRTAVAIENARLYKQAKELAVVEERSRLARDLHDAVTQTLFSASLIAEVLPDIWEKDPDEGKQLLKEVRQLSRGALTEMRALLLELRPAALAEAKLDVLIRQLAEAASGRTGVPINVAVEGECEIPPDVHIAIYRVAQEALNNIVKHAHASQVEINLRCSKASMNNEKSIVELNIHDDGCGFDTACASPDQMGLRIMRERTEAIGAKLEIKSKPGAGTRINVVWKEDKG